MSEQPDLIRTLSEAKIPFMRIISARKDPQDGFPCVYVDDRDAAYAITEHLIQLGHQRIGFLWGGSEHRSSPERYQGYEDALKDYGIALDRKLMVPGDYTFDDGFPRRAQTAGAEGSTHRDLRLERRDRRRRAGRGAFGRHQRAVRLVDRRLRGQPVLQAVLAGADHRAAGHRGDRPPRGAALDRRPATRRQRRTGAHLGNEGFSPELVVRGSTAPRHTAPPKR
jgi:LacI family transcriptional regulator